MDFLVRWIQKLTEVNFLSPPFPQCRSCLLYADDTLLILRPSRNQLLKAGLLFCIFGQLSGLKVNFSKSELSVTSASPFFTQTLAAQLQCKAATFPIRYLGLPLSDKRITKADFLPLIDKIQAKLTTWKASLLSVGGRTILVNSVLTAIPQFFMAVFLLPKWVLRKIDQIRRTFLWHGHRDQQGRNRGLYMVNWSLVTRPKSLGGLGVRDTCTTNKALLAKWMWQWLNSACTWWKEATPMFHASQKPWHDPRGSAFWKSISTIAPPFDSSVRYRLGNGETINFWYDNWLGTPLRLLFPALYHAVPQQQNFSVSHYSAGAGWALQFPLLSPTAQQERDELLLQLQQVCTTQETDEVVWLRATTSFTVRSFYKFLSCSPSPTSPLKNLWSIKAPFRVMIFVWLMLNNRLTTVDNLTRRGWYLPNMCVMCKQSEESVLHLFIHCTLAKQLRGYIYSAFAAHFRMSPRFTTAHSIEVLTDPVEEKSARNWELTTCFIIWRERCRRVFSDKISSQMSLVREIRREYTDWFTQTLNAAVPHSD